MFFQYISDHSLPFPAPMGVPWFCLICAGSDSLARDDKLLPNWHGAGLVALLWDQRSLGRLKLLLAR